MCVARLVVEMRGETSFRKMESVDIAQLRVVSFSAGASLPTTCRCRKGCPGFDEAAVAFVLTNIRYTDARPPRQLFRRPQSASPFTPSPAESPQQSLLARPASGGAEDLISSRGSSSASVWLRMVPKATYCTRFERNGGRAFAGLPADCAKKSQASPNCERLRHRLRYRRRGVRGRRGGKIGRPPRLLSGRARSVGDRLLTCVA